MLEWVQKLEESLRYVPSEPFNLPIGIFGLLFAGIFIGLMLSFINK